MIKVSSIFKFSNENEWTICLNNAPQEGTLYSFDQNPVRMRQHLGWIRKRNSSDRRFRVINKYCLQFIRLDKDSKKDQWIFVGAFENKGEINDAEGNDIYNLQSIDVYNEYKDRLVIEYKRTPGSKQVKIPISKFLNQNVVSILERPYINTVYPFPGYSNLSISFRELKKIISQNIDNWRELLMNVQCVYCITDTNTGGLYIGSTYGQKGIWQRWKTYADTNGSGGDVELKRLIDSDSEYANKYFMFTVIELFFNTNSNEEKIREREQYFGKVFRTQEFGNYNHNLY